MSTRLKSTRAERKRHKQRKPSSLPSSPYKCRSSPHCHTKSTQALLHEQIKSYDTFPHSESHPHHEGYGYAERRVRSVSNITQAASNSSVSSSEKDDPKSITSRLTIDQLLQTPIDPTKPERPQTLTSPPIGQSSTQHSSNDSLRRVAHTSQFSSGTESTSPTVSTDEESNIRSTVVRRQAGPRPLLHHPPTLNNDAEKMNNFPINALCLGKSTFKGILCAIFIASVVSSTWLDFERLHHNTTDVIVLRGYETIDFNKTLPSNTSDFSIQLEVIYIPKNLPCNETFISVSAPQEQHCTINNITQFNISRWKRNPIFAILKCWHLYEIQNDQLEITLTNEQNFTIGLALDFNSQQLHWSYFATVLAIMLLIQISLLIEFVKPLAVVAVSAGLATTLQAVYEKQAGVGTSSYGSLIEPGSIADQVLLAAGLMILVSFLIHCGAYSSLTYKISSLSRYKWKAVIAVLLIFTSLLSCLSGRLVSIQFMVPLAICISEAYHIVGSKLVAAVLVMANVSNLLFPIGNDVLRALPVDSFDTTDLFDNAVAPLTSVAGVCACGMATLYLVSRWLGGLVEANTETFTRDTHKANILHNWKEKIVPLTKADLACWRFADDAHRSLDQALHNPQNMPIERYIADSSEDNGYLTYLALRIDANYYMTDWPSFCYCGPIAALTIVAMPAAQWIQQQPNGVIFPPGVIAITAAVCLFVLSNSWERVAQSIDWSTLIFIALYRYTMEQLLGGTVLDAVAYLYRGVSVSSVGCEVKAGLSAVIIWISALASALVGVETFSPEMVQLFQELFLANDQKSLFWNCVACQIIGSTLSGNVFLYASLGNVIASGCSKEHGIKLGRFSFVKLGLPITLLTLMTASVTAMVYTVADCTSQNISASASHV